MRKMMTSDENDAERDERSASVADRLSELSRQVDETRKQMIKTANMLGNLSAEVRSIGRIHQQHRRGLTLNSAAAYLLFVVLVASAFYFVYRSRIERVDFEKNVLVRERLDAQTKLEALQREATARRVAEEKAADFYRLSRSGRVQKALRQYPEVARLPLSRVEVTVFKAWATRVRNKMAYSAYAAGMKATGEKQWKRAATEFRHALQFLPNPPHEASLRYYLGISLMRLGSYTEAAEELERALKADAERTVSRETRFHLGTIYEQIGRRHKAIKAYQEYIKRHGGTNFARAARRRIKALE